MKIIEICRNNWKMIALCVAVAVASSLATVTLNLRQDGRFIPMAGNVAIALDSRSGTYCSTGLGRPPYGLPNCKDLAKSWR